MRQNGIKEPLGFSPVESLTDLRRCYEFREIPLNLPLLLRRRIIVLKLMAAIAHALAELEEATHKGRHRADADFEFHLAIAIASGNQYLQTSIESLKEHIAVGMTSHGMSLKHENNGLDNVYNEHEAIFNAIKNRDPESARFLMRSHISGSSARILEAGEWCSSRFLGIQSYVIPQRLEVMKSRRSPAPWMPGCDRLRSAKPVPPAPAGSCR
ncbi:MAG: FCD domain-containing protein [Thiolinea sp.]